MALIPTFEKKASIAFMGAENSADLDYLDMDFQRKLYVLISKLYEGGYRYFYTGLYEGFDLMAAEVLTMLRKRGGHDEAKLICCVTSSSQADDYYAVNRAHFVDILSDSDNEKCIIGMHNFPGSKLAIEDEFIEACGLVLCWDDGEDSDLTFSLDKAAESGLQIMNFRDIQEEEI